MPIAAKPPVLDLDTLAPERATVKIRSKQHPDGKLYELAHIEDIGLRDQSKLRKLGTEVTDLAVAAEKALHGEGEEDDLLAFEKAVDGFLAVVVLDLPAEVLAALNINQKEALIDAFTSASPTLAKAVKEARTPARAKARKKSGAGRKRRTPAS